MSRARVLLSRARTVIQASAQPLWQGTPLAGDRQIAGFPHSREGASGPMAACRQSRTTRPGSALVAWDMPVRSFALSRGRVVLAGRAGDGTPPGPALAS